MSARCVAGVEPGSASAQGQNGRVGPSVLILRYVLEDGVSCFSLEMVRHYWLGRGVDVDRRRYHDSALRLTRRGILERRERGWYCVKDWVLLYSYLEQVSPSSRREETGGQPSFPQGSRRGNQANFPYRLNGETVLEACQSIGRTDAGRAGEEGRAGRRGLSESGSDGSWRRRGFVPVFAGDGCLTVLRWHLNARRGQIWDWLWDLFERAVAFRELFSWLVRWLREELRRLGASKYEVRRRIGRVLARVRRLLERVRPVIGAHWQRRFRPLEELLRMFAGVERLPRMEFGVELWACGELRAALEAAREGYEVFGSQDLYVPNGYRHNTPEHARYRLRLRYHPRH